MISVLLVAYMLNGNEVLKTTQIDPNIVQTCQEEDGHKRQVMILNQLFKGKNNYLIKERCDIFLNRVNKAKWGDK